MVKVALNPRVIIIPARDPKQCGGEKGYCNIGRDDDDDNDDDDDDDVIRWMSRTRRKMMMSRKI